MATMATKRDYYEVLGVERTARARRLPTLIASWRSSITRTRTRVTTTPSRCFKEAAEAFEVLSDTDKRSRYDRYGHAGVDGPGGGAPHFTDVNDIFEAFGDIFGDSGFGDLFGRGRAAAAAAPRKGGDVRCDVTLDLFEAARGVTKTVEFERHEECTDCDGTGREPGTKPEKCHYCGGRGQVVQSRASSACRPRAPPATAPAAVDQRSVHRLPRRRLRACNGQARSADSRRRRQRHAGAAAGRRRPDPHGGPRGDCYCFLHVKEHSLFQRDGHNLICQMPITYSQAALGATIEVPTLDGDEELEIPPARDGRGVSAARPRHARPARRGKGDLLVQVNIEVPKSLTPRQEELLRELAEEEHTNVTPHRKSFFEKLREYFVPEEAHPGEYEEFRLNSGCHWWLATSAYSECTGAPATSGTQQVRCIHAGPAGGGESQP